MNAMTRADWSELARFCGKLTVIYACIAAVLWLAMR